MVAIVPGSCESRRVTELVERSATWMARAVRDARGLRRRAVRRPRGADRRARPGDQRARAPAARRGARGGGRRRRGARPRRRGRSRCTASRSPPRTRSRWRGCARPTARSCSPTTSATRTARRSRGCARRGAILLGKTNVSEFSMWWDSANELFGATANPHDPSRTAGGSSGGEAAAIASGMSPLGLGSDLGGSIRNPCHFVGVFGLKPGRDTVPFAEHAPLPAGPGIRLMGVVGPMARFAARPRAGAGRARDAAARAGAAPLADRGLRGGRAAAGLARLPRGGPAGGRGAGGRGLRDGRGRAAERRRGARRVRR